MTTEPTVELMSVTPALANAWLERNVRNRNLNRDLVRLIAGAISRGEWKLTGDTVKFSADGRLLDGQHRLAAVVYSETTVPMFVAWGIDPDAQLAMDAGRKRRLSDHLQMAGEVNAKPLAHALRGLWEWEHSGFSLASGSASMFTNAQAFDLLDRHPKIRDSVLLGLQANNRTGYSPGRWASHVYVYSLIDPNTAQVWHEQFTSGEALPPRSPVLALRDRVLSQRGRTKGKLSERYLDALTIKAWNAFYLGVPIGRLAWNMTEDFPEIIDDPRGNL